MITIEAHELKADDVVIGVGKVLRVATSNQSGHVTATIKGDDGDTYNTHWDWDGPLNIEDRE